MTHAEAMRGVDVYEGSISAAEADFLSNLVAGKGKLTVVQTGLGWGRSAWAFLSANPSVTLVSFDLGSHPAIADGCVQGVLEKHFPGRHAVVLGDSSLTVPAHRSLFEDATIAFVDGGHSFDTALADLRNFRAAGRTVVLDDLTSSYAGVQDAWEHANNQGWIIEAKTVMDGSHAWGVGRYA